MTKRHNVKKPRRRGDLRNLGEWDWPPDCSRDKDAEPWNKQKRLELIKDTASRIGYQNIIKRKIAERTGVDRRTILRDFDTLYKAGIDPHAGKIAMIEIDAQFNSVINDLQQLFIVSNKPTEKSTLANSLIQAIEKKQAFLERFGIHKPEQQIIDNKLTVTFAETAEEAEKIENEGK